jgi:hypothetical protein
VEDGGVKEGGDGCLKLFGVTLVILLAIALMLGAGFWFVGDTIKRQFMAQSPETVAQASLQGLREQNRLSAFAAKFVAVVTSKQSQLGFTAQKTMIMPGSVRYEVDLSKLRQEDVTWDAAAKRLTVNLPQVEATDPAVDLNNIRQYDNGGIMLSVTDVGSKLDEANRKAGQVELLKQAQSAPYMRMARDATRKAIESSFVMPLKAAGIDATVQVLFPDEANRPTERWDESRRPEDVLRNSH